VLETGSGNGGFSLTVPLGRADQLEAIDGFLSQVSAGGTALVLAGGPGIGKTTLLETAAERANAAGMRLLSASGAEFETDLTFAGLHQLLLPLRDRFHEHPQGQVLDVALGLAAGPAPDRLVAANATLDVLTQTADGQVTLLMVDDLLCSTEPAPPSWLCWPVGSRAAASDSSAPPGVARTTFSSMPDFPSWMCPRSTPYPPATCSTSAFLPFRSGPANKSSSKPAGTRLPCWSCRSRLPGPDYTHRPNRQTRTGPPAGSTACSTPGSAPFPTPQGNYFS
jgi:hypothetical protein